MSYTINHYNGTLLATVADGTVDTSTDLTLIGKNYAGYGQSQNDNFVWLLENFANTTQPPNPLAGQIWYDSGNKKLKFWDGSYFRQANGAEVGTAQPAGLTQGDFFFNTASNQLYVYNGSGLTLVGPQEVTGAGTTQMQSVSLTDSSGLHSYPVIQAIANGTVVAIISNSSFTMANNVVPGFDQIVQGITLVDTQASTNGVTSGGYRFEGTASNALMLNGLPASSYVTLSSSAFTQASFSSGFTVGANNNLSLSIASGNVINVSQPTVSLTSTGGFLFQTTALNGSTVTPLELIGTDLIPGQSGVSSLGSSSYQWLNVYASSFVGTATQANLVNLPGYGYAQANMTASANTIAGRDGNGNLSANLFQGTATSANYADLAEKYLPDVEYAPGTVVMVGGEKEITACTTDGYALGVISTNPAYMMNSELKGGVYVALRGRVPVKIEGPVNKGDLIYPGSNGSGFSINATPNMTTTSPGNNPFAIALEDKLDAQYNDINIIECVIL